LALVFGASLCFALPSPRAFGQIGGVAVDAHGVLRTFESEDPTSELTRRKIAEARAALGADVARASKLRKVSLGRLEKALAKRLSAGGGPTDEMAHLAGLTRVEYVFFYPETRDIVLAGPAEGWAEVAPGRVVGIESGQATLELQDLAVALRTFPPGSRQAPLVSCSIDPTKEGLARMQQFLRTVRPTPTAQGAAAVVEGLKTSLGTHTVSIGGVPVDSHAAQVLVEADYRMKLIGLGIEPSVAKMRSYVDLANAGTISRNAMQRWYFIPDYQCVRVADDGLAMQVVGGAVQLVSADEVVLKDGTRRNAGSVNSASKKFTDSFTRLYPAIAKGSPVFGQLRNLIDLLVVAAFLQDQDYYGKADWRAATLGDEKAYRVQTYQKPVEVETACRAVWKGRTLVTPVGGGIAIRANKALASGNLLEDEGGQVAAARDSVARGKVSLDKLPAGQWWWD